MGSAASTPVQPGAAQSRQSRSAPAKDLDEKRGRQLQEAIAQLKISDGASIPSHLTLSAIDEWRETMQARPGQALASTVLSKQDINAALLSRKTITRDQHLFNTSIDHEMSPVTNQMSSGRCWLFSATNVARHAVAKNLNLAPDASFELSQAYLFAWDHVEKAAHYLELVGIELAQEPLDSRVIQYLNESPLNDGGQWDMLVNLIEKYGLVPKTVYPESWNSSNSSRLDGLLTHMVRGFALDCRRAHASALSASTATTQLARLADAVSAARSVKAKAMARIVDTIFTSCGTPPMPDESFTFEYKTKDGKVQTITSTALEFASKYAAPFKPSECISIVNDPRNEYNRLMTVQYLNNVHGARPCLYVNAPSSRLSSTVVSEIQAGRSCWFGCDSGAWMEGNLGIWDTKLYDYDAAFGVKLNMTKEERLRTGDSAMTHAMVFTAVHLDADGKPIRYRIENSWGDSRGDHGYFLATQEWFDEFVYQVVAPRSAVPKELRRVFEEQQTDPLVLPPWDPMGTLA